MAIILNRTTTFATNGTVTAAGLHNLIDDTAIYSGLITTQTNLASVGTGDKLLIAQASGGDTTSPFSTTVLNLFEDALTGGTYTNAQLSGFLTYGTATGNRTVSTSATITTGTIPNLTSSTANITLGTIPTLTAGTTTSTAATITTGTIGTLVATGTITGSTNVVNIGSGQIYKDASGNVGIGITNPSVNLEVVGANGIRTRYDTSGNGFLISQISSAGDAYINNQANSGIVLATNNAERLRIDSSGNVGIGTASPNSMLVVTSGTSPNRSQIIIGSTGLSENFYDSNTHYFRNGSQPASEKMRIDSSGNVGIGVSSPVNKLEVVGSFGRGAPVTKTADFTLADTENWLIVNKAAATCTVTLPAASSWTGREFTIKTLQAFTVVSASSNVVPRNGTAAGTAILAAVAGNWATLVSNGTAWVIMCGS